MKNRAFKSFVALMILTTVTLSGCANSKSDDGTSESSTAATVEDVPVSDDADESNVAASVENDVSEASTESDTTDGISYKDYRYAEYLKEIEKHLNTNQVKLTLVIDYSDAYKEANNINASEKYVVEYSVFDDVRLTTITAKGNTIKFYDGHQFDYAGFNGGKYQISNAFDKSFLDFSSYITLKKDFTDVKYVKDEKYQGGTYHIVSASLGNIDYTFYIDVATNELKRYEIIDQNIKKTVDFEAIKGIVIPKDIDGAMLDVGNDEWNQAILDFTFTESMLETELSAEDQLKNRMRDDLVLTLDCISEMEELKIKVPDFPEYATDDEILVNDNGTLSVSFTNHYTADMTVEYITESGFMYEDETEIDVKKLTNSDNDMRVYNAIHGYVTAINDYLDAKYDYCVNYQNLVREDGTSDNE